MDVLRQYRRAWVEAYVATRLYQAPNEYSTHENLSETLTKLCVIKISSPNKNRTTYLNRVFLHGQRSMDIV